MNIHEYQAKQILGRFGVPVPKGQFATTPDEAAAAFTALGQPKAVCKAQIHAGGRGKAGGVKLLNVANDVRDFAAKLLGQPLVTHQTGPEGRVVRRIYIEEASDIARELYLGMLVDRKAGTVSVIASTEGGMDIEEVAAKTPEKILTEQISPLLGVSGFPGAQDCVRARAQGQAGRPVRDAVDGALSRIRRDRRVAYRDQSAGRDEGQSRHLP